MTDAELYAIEVRQKEATPPGRVIFESGIIERDVPALLDEVRRLRDLENRKRCPCEFPEVNACDDNCSCRNKVMSGGCQRCASYGSYEQQLAAAKGLVTLFDEYYFGGDD